jgi:hypothetical protein
MSWLRHVRACQQKKVQANAQLNGRIRRGNQWRAYGRYRRSALFHPRRSGQNRDAQSQARGPPRRGFVRDGLRGHPRQTSKLSTLPVLSRRRVRGVSAPGPVISSPAQGIDPATNRLGAGRASASGFPQHQVDCSIGGRSLQNCVRLTVYVSGLHRFAPRVVDEVQANLGAHHDRGPALV